jgi:hypothetical protein
MRTIWSPVAKMQLLVHIGCVFLKGLRRTCLVVVDTDFTVIDAINTIVLQVWAWNSG